MIKIISKEWADNIGDNEVWYIGYVDGGYLIPCPYRGYTESDALDDLADYAQKHVPGLIATDDCVAELILDAVRDGRGYDRIYVDERYTMAGNESAYIEIPQIMEEMTIKDAVKKFGYIDIGDNLVITGKDGTK